MSKLDTKCPNCGYDERKDSVNQKLSDDKILITKDETKRLELVQLAFYAIILLLGIVLFFFPIFTIKYSLDEDFTNIKLDSEDWQQLMKGEKITFSYFDETVRLFQNITAENSDINIHDLFSSLLGLILSISVIIFIIFFGFYKAVRSLISIKTIDNRRVQCFLKFEKYPKEPIIESPTRFSIVLPFVLAICDGFFAFGAETTERKMIKQKFFDFSNFTGWFIVAVILFIGFFALAIYANNYDKKLRKEIIARRKERKENNKKKNEESRQKKLENKSKEKESDAKKSENKNNAFEREKKFSDMNETRIKSNRDSSVQVNVNTSFDELKKLKDLLDAGIITQEEFDAKKKQLLGL